MPVEGTQNLYGTVVDEKQVLNVEATGAATVYAPVF